MTGSMDCRDIRQALGVYVLGAIDPAERGLVDAHLSTCPECREELAGLAGLPALLRRVPVNEAEGLAHDELDEASSADPIAGDQMLRSLLAKTARRRRERMWRGLAAAAAIILVAGSAGAAGWNLLQPSAGGGQQTVSATHWRTVAGTDRATLTSVKVRFAPRSWGTSMNVQVRGVPVGTDCQFQVTDSSGHRSIVGGWTATYGDSSFWYPGATSIPVQNMRSFEITSGGKVLVSVPAQ